MRKIIRFLLPLSLVLAGLIYYKNKTMPTQLYPRPYLFKKDLFSEELTKKVSTEHLVMLGDQKGHALVPYIQNALDELSKQLQERLTIYDWTETNEGIHRSYNKLSRLEKLPKILFYQVGTSEFYEKKFDVLDHLVMKANLRTYNDEIKLTAIQALPVLSKFLYQRVNYVLMDENINKDETAHTSLSRQVQMELVFKLFEDEITQIITEVKQKKGNIVLITNPVNLTLRPRKVCQNAITEQTENHVRKLKKLAASGDNKSAYSLASKIEKQMMGHAEFFYEFGMAAMAQGKYAEAKNLLYQADAFDCDPQDSTTVFNNITRKVASHFGVPIIDFDNLVNKYLGRNLLFLDDRQPQFIYYQEVGNITAKYVREVFNI